LASIENIQYEELPYQIFDDFKIIETQELGSVSVNVPPDVSICTACEKELFDTSNRRYGYPFITCTDCGVRYSIIYNLPYDRQKTSMKHFTMCKVCEEEYTNPLDRRYHAQPIGCYDCGPKLKLMDNLGLALEGNINEVDKTVELLKKGHIIAIKGLG
jgi:hydrogenase maturation protein HypF